MESPKHLRFAVARERGHALLGKNLSPCSLVLSNGLCIYVSSVLRPQDRTTRTVLVRPGVTLQEVADALAPSLAKVGAAADFALSIRDKQAPE